MNEEETLSATSGLASTGRQVRLVDLPGHPRLRDQILKYKADIWGVVFVVDVVGIVRNAAGVAE